MSPELVLIAVSFFVLLQAFFTGSKIALISCDKIKMRSLADEGSGSAKMVIGAFNQIEDYLGTSIVGANISLVASVLLLTFYLDKLGGSASILYSVLILSPAVVLFGHLVPKAVFQKKRNSIILWAIYPLWFFSKIFYPALKTLNLFTKTVARATGKDKSQSVSREELMDVIEDDTGKAVYDYKKRVLRRIFGFSETTVNEIMIPLVNVDSLEEQSSVEDAIRLIKSTGHSRIPIYKERIDNITGILNSFYLLGPNITPQDDVKKYALSPYYVPETKLVNNLLDEMKVGRAGMAVVVDEYGGAVGIITLEDILEEVVGEIEDEYDKGRKLWRKLKEGQYLINPVIEIPRLNDELGTGIPEGDEYETLSGYLLTKFGSIPEEGQKIKLKNKTFTVTRATKRAIIEVRLKIGK